MFARKPILIVEDEAFIALNLALAIEDLGGEVVGPVASVADALELLTSREIMAAVFDVNLVDRDVTPVAIKLDVLGVPFVVHTACDIPAAMCAALRKVPLVRKPAPPTLVLQHLLAEIDQKPSDDRVLPFATDFSIVRH